jgi:hypothetical protein
VPAFGAVYTTHGTLPPVAPSLFLEIHGLATDCGCPLLRSNRLRRGKKEESRFFHGHGNQPLSFLFFSSVARGDRGPCCHMGVRRLLSRSIVGISLYLLISYLLGLLLFSDPSFFPERSLFKPGPRYVRIEVVGWTDTYCTHRLLASAMGIASHHCCRPATVVSATVLVLLLPGVNSTQFYYKQ